MELPVVEERCVLFAADAATWTLRTELRTMARTHTMIAEGFGRQRLHTLLHGHLLQCVTLLSVVSASAIVALCCEFLLLLWWRVDELMGVRWLFFDAALCCRRNGCDIRLLLSIVKAIWKF